MKINFFSPASALFPFRWFIVITLMVSLFVVIADQLGWRLLSSSGQQQQWNARGPGYHK